MSHPGDGEAGTPHRHLFFLSYAHTPRVEERTADPDWAVRKFFEDLCAEIVKISKLKPAEVGFMDRRMDVGVEWPVELSSALAHCQVFVPLYSPRYFDSPFCGGEWSAFAEREVHGWAGASGRPTGIVPVLWTRLDNEDLPVAASELQFTHEQFGDVYAAEGLDSLMNLRSLRDEYRRAVRRLAERILAVERDTLIRQGEIHPFSEYPNAFGPPRRPKTLRISVLACDKRSVPEGRSDQSYGKTSLDWWPYHGQPPARGIGWHAMELARQLGLEPTLHALDAVDDGGIDQTAASDQVEGAGLLIMDRWALRDPQRRSIAERFDRSGPSWVGLLEPWCRDDPECVEERDALRGLADTVLSRKRRRPRLGVVPRELETLGEFEAELPEAALRALRAFRESGRRRPRSGRDGRSRRSGPPSLGFWPDEERPPGPGEHGKPDPGPDGRQGPDDEDYGGPGGQHRGGGS